MDVKGNKKAILKTCTQANEERKEDIWSIKKFKEQTMCKKEQSSDPIINL